MPGFQFQTISPDGRRARGREHAASADSLIRVLEARGLVVLDVQEHGADALGTPRASRAAVADAMRALASLLPAGLSLVRALDVAAGTAPSALAGILRDVRSRVERGEGVAAAFAAHPQAFSAAAVGVVRAGERAGDLDGAFDRLAAQLERDGALRARLLSAAIYPAILAVAGGAALLVLLLFVLPRFAALLEGTGMPLPASTALLLGAATALRANWVLIPVALAALMAAFAWLRTSPVGRRAWSRTLLALPVVGGFRRDALAAGTARTLAVLLHGGAPLPAALDDAAGSADDPLLGDALHAARARVVAGSTLHAACAAERVFSEVFLSLVATGEEAGRLPEFLERAAVFFEQRTERGAQRLVAFAEPAMIVAFGVVIGAVALSLLQAIYGINPAGLR
jgi:type II secretory pathway component PulF